MKSMVSVWFVLLVALLQPAQRPAYLPDPKLTPGAVFPTVTAKDVCVPGYAKSVRDVPGKIKHLVYLRYGMKGKHPACEIDHLVSLELGGSNAVTNLFPEPYDTVVDGRQMGAGQKDKIETRLHAMVCRDEISLADAQKAIRTDWTIPYRKYVGEFPKAEE